MFLIFINIAIVGVGKLKYTNDLQPVKYLHIKVNSFVVSLFSWNIYFKEHFVEAAFEAVLIIIEIELSRD